MSIKGSPVVETQENLLKGQNLFNEVQKIDLSSYSAYGEDLADHRVDGISQLRTNLVHLEQLQSKMLFMMNEISSIVKF